MRIGPVTAIFAAIASTGAAHPVPASAAKPTCEAPGSRVDALRQAFFFAFPLYEMARMRQRMLSVPGAEPNRLQHRAILSRPKDRSITTPNNDTLYSSAWLDLADGPVEFTIPPMGSRYHSAELMHAFSDAFAMLRNESDQARTFMIVGPQWNGQPIPGQTVVRSPTRDAWLVIRTFVAGHADLAEAQRLQGLFAVRAARHPSRPDIADATIAIEPDARQFLSIVNRSLARGPLPVGLQDRLACFAGSGVVARDPASGNTLDPATHNLWDANIAQFYRDARLAFEKAGSLHHGWRYPASNIAAFGADDLYRSAMALGGLGAMPVDEAVNPVAMADKQGKTLSGSSRYELRIPGHVPVRGFWSLTLYESDGAGRWYLHENPIARYAISSATEGLHRAPDGSIAVEISSSPPGDPANWLPAPKGRFMLVFRAYRPLPPMLDGTFRLPPVKRIS
jgi:hypothetical protein